MLSKKLPHRTCKQKAVPGTDLLKMSSFDMFENCKHPTCCWRCRCLKWNRSLSLKSVVRFWSEVIEDDIWRVDPTSLQMRNVCQGLQGQAANKKTLSHKYFIRSQIHDLYQYVSWSWLKQTMTFGLINSLWKLDHCRSSNKPQIGKCGSLSEGRARRPCRDEAWKPDRSIK